MNGQLMPKEREFLYNSVLEAKPNMVLEVGTWKGGGSTWQISEALYANNHGMLHTCETDLEFFLEAKQVYAKLDRVETWLLRSTVLIQSLIEFKRFPDFIFFDGPEDETTALEDFKALDAHLETGAVFMMHDWDHPSIKAKLIRPYLESLSTWKIVSCLTAPESVGLVKAIKL